MDRIKKAFRLIFSQKRYVALFLLFAAAYITLLVLFKKYQITQDEIRTFVEPLGMWGLLALLGVQIFFSLTPLPDGAMPLLGMIIYGPLGLLIVFLGMFIAAVIHYFIGKLLGKTFIEKKFPLIKRFADKFNGDHVIIKLIYLRIFSVVSFDITSYVAGISRIEFNTFIIATIIGLIPTNLALMLISSGLFAQDLGQFVITWFWALIIISLLAFWYKKSTIKVN